MNFRFAVVIVNYNTREHLLACLASALAEHPWGVVVVDNASRDGSVELVRSTYPEVTLRSNPGNPGYGAAANQGISASDAEYVLLLNSDTLIHRGALGALEKYLDENPNAAVVGPRLVNPDGTLQPSTYPYPTPFHVLMEESTLARWVRYLPLFRERYLRTWSHEYSQNVPWVLGAAMAIRRSAFETVGGFDESYFLYWEEVDLCHRLRETGWKIHFSPVATVTHTGGASTAPRRGEMTRHLFTSAALFYRRHYSPTRLLALRAVIMTIMVLRVGRELVRFSYGFLCHESFSSRASALPPSFGSACEILADAAAGWRESAPIAR